MIESHQDATALELALPEPTGKYAVGTTNYSFVDREREDTYTEDPDDNREITAKVWYPSKEISEANTAPYFGEELGSAIASGLEIPTEDFNNFVQSIPTNSVANAPIAEAESEYPVLILSHGFGGLPELNTIQAEELASRGYIVVGINHTYDSAVNILSDGTVVPSTAVPEEASESEVSELIEESIEIRTEDAQFVLDELEDINAADDSAELLSGKIDLNRLGIYGFSLGGATAAKVLSIDSRFQAGVNLDGGLFGDVGEASLAQPFMFLNNEAFGTGNSSDPFEIELNQVQQSFVENLQNDGYEITIAGTQHFNFNDLSFLSPLLANSGIQLGQLEEILSTNGDNDENFEPTDPLVASQIISNYTTAFFDRYLKGQKSPLLADDSSPYPEVTFQSYLAENTAVVNPPETQFGTVDADILEINTANQLVFAGDGNDLIDASFSSGNNRIDTGDGDDTVILGTGDRIVAGVGADRFFTGSGGDNTLTGGAGADQFWIAVAQTPGSPNTITDFNHTEDVIGIAGLNLGFDDLNISQSENDVLISGNGSELAILQGINADSLSADNFVG